MAGESKCGNAGGMVSFPTKSMTPTNLDKAYRCSAGNSKADHPGTYSSSVDKDNISGTDGTPVRLVHCALVLAISHGESSGCARCLADS